MLLCAAMAAGMSGCGKKKKITYGDLPATATGKIDLSGREPVIAIDNIKAEVGEDIDYTSKIDLVGAEGDYSVDVNASNVKYDTPGTYHVGYTVKTDKGTYSSNIKVTIEGETVEQEGGAADGSGGAAVVQDGEGVVAGEDNAPEQGGSAGGQPEINPNGAVGQNAGEGQNGALGSQNSADSQGGASGGQNSAGGQGSAGGSQSSAGGQNGAVGQTEKRELITGKSNTVYQTKKIENAVIELLSGDVVTISCTTNKYITQTRTDVSQVTRNGHTYEVSKLVIVFNTGAERTLETVEKKID